MAIGTLEIVILLAIILIIFGPKNIPKLAKALGNAVRGYKEGVHGSDSTSKPKKRKKLAG